MKHYLYALIMIIMLVSASGIVLASNVDNAEYLTTITITNNGTALTNETVVFTLSTADMISNGMLNATATDYAVLTGSGGSDVYSGPSVNSTYPWCVFVSSIGATTDTDYSLYSKGVTGGSIAYFPGAAGMTIADDASIEPSDNFSIEIQGMIDEAGTILTKPDAITLTRGTSNITATIGSTESEQDALTSGDADQAAVYGVNWEAQTFTASASYLMDKVKLKLLRYGTGGGTITVGLKATSGSKPTGAYLDSTTMAGGDIATTAGGTWYDFELDYQLSSGTMYAIVVSCPSGDGVDGILWRMDSSSPPYSDGARNYSGDSGSSWTTDATKDYMFAVWSGGVNLVANSITSAHKTIRVWSDSSNLHLSVNGVETDNETTISVPSNSVNWTVGSENVTPYILAFTIDVGGVEKCNISWEYDTTFTDASGNNNDATPTFRTSSSDSDLTASITAIEGLITGSTPTANVSGGWTMIGSVPSTPGDLFSEGDYSYKIGDLDFGQQVENMANNAGQDAVSWHIVFVFALALGAMLLVFKITHNTSMGQRGSLLMATLAAEGVLIYFYIITTIPGFVLIPFGLIALLMILWKKSPGPID